MKRAISFFFALVMLTGLFGNTAFADPLDENGDTGGEGPGGNGGYIELWNNPWNGMRITVIDVSDPAREIGGEQWGKVAAGTKSVDVTALEASSAFFTRTLAGDGTTALSQGNKVAHFGKVSKMAYRDGASLSMVVGAYEFQPVPNCPITMGGSRASAQTIKDFINNQGMLTNIAGWCGGGLTYETLTSGKYKLLVEPVMYCLIQSNKYAFTATEAALLKPHGNSTGYPLINNTLANAFYLEYDELGWDAWTGSTSINQPFDTIVSSLGMHIYSIAPDTLPPKSVKILKKSGTGAPLSGAKFSITGNGKNEPITVNGTFTLDLDGWENGTYTVTEKEPPVGYDLNATPQTFTISDGGVTPTELTFINTGTPPPPPPDNPPPVEVKMKKVEYGTDTGLGGAVFQLTQLSHWEKRLVDPNESENPGEEWELVDPDDGDTPQDNAVVADKSDDVWEWLEIRETEVVGTFVSGADGTIPAGALEPGSYVIEEITPPAGYVLQENTHERIQTFDIPREGGYSGSIVFANKKLPGLTILKVDETTGLPLAGAEFSIRHNGNIVYEGLTDASGIINLPDLEPGWYGAVELAAPDGYLIRAEHKDVLLSAGSSAQLKFDNIRKPTLTIRKYDELTGEPLSGASFRLWKTEGETWSESQVTGADGTITWTDLDPGIYSVQEIDEPYGYFKDPARKEILLEGGDNKELEFFNRPRPVLTILKLDLVTGQPLADVKFRVQRLEGETIGEFLTGADGLIELSPATGYLLTEEIYRVTEIQPPDGYLLDTVNVKDVMLKWYEPTETVFENVLKPTLIFIKRNGLTGRGIDNATYKVEFEGAGGGIVNLGTYKTKCGLIVIPHVHPGWYILTETLPAPGYSLPTNPVQRMYLAPGQNSYTHAQTDIDVYVDRRTDPSSGTKGMCGDWCGYLCGGLCAGNCGNPGGGNMAGSTGGAFGNMVITNGNGDPLGTAKTPAPAPAPTPDPAPNPDPPPSSTGGVIFINPDFAGITIKFGK